MTTLAQNLTYQVKKKIHPRLCMVTLFFNNKMAMIHRTVSD